MSASDVALKERIKSVMLILEQHQLDKGLPPLDERILVMRAKSAEVMLTKAGIPVERYDEIYQEAMLYYTDKAPFNVLDMLRAWRNIQDKITWVDGDGVEHIYDPSEDRRNGVSEASIQRTIEMFKCGGGRLFHTVNGRLICIFK